MNTDQMNIPDREIREDEQELLDHIWSAAASQTGISEATGFDELTSHIHRRVWRHRIFRLSMLSGAAAIAVVATLFFKQPTPPPPTEVYVQLQQMGVAVDRPQVLLTADDGMRVTLDSMARIEQQAGGNVALHTASGEQPLAAERKLRVEVPVGRQFQMTLSDGSQVWLNAGSTLEYPATFENKSERRVRLTGEAFFDVQRNPKQPFFVELGSNEVIRVIGTSFNVCTYAENRYHTTTLLTGKVSYTTPSGETSLAPNQQLNLDCSTGTTRIQEVDASAYGAWKEGWLWFEAEKLSSLAARLSRIYGITIRVDERFQDYSFSGKIRQERGIDYILNLVTETTPITYEVSDGVIHLK